MKNKSLIISVFALLASLGAGYGIANLEKEKSLPIEDATHEDAHGDKEKEVGFIKISDEDAKASGIETDKINFGTGSEIQILGRIEASPEARILVSAPISGRISRLYVAIGSIVNKGSPLYEIISAEGAAIVADEKVATANIQMATASSHAAVSAYKSDEWLYKKGVISLRELETSKANALNAEANIIAQAAYANSAKAKIVASGSPKSNGAILVRAPISGVVGNMPITIGSFASQGSPTGEITNINNTEAVFQIAPSMLYNLKIGGRIEVKTDDNRKFSAVIKAIAPGFNQGANNSIIRAKIEGDNLAIGSILSASINTQSGNQNLMPLVPTAAIIATESGNAVFVKTKNGFKLTNVLIGNSFNEKTEIKRGLKGDEEIAINNTFLLKSELAKGEVEHDH